MSSIKDIQAKRIAINTEVRAILDNENATQDEKVKADGLLAEMNSLAADVARIQKADAADAEMRSIKFPPESDPTGKQGDKLDEKAQSELELRSMYKFCVRGRSEMSSEENACIKHETRAVESTSPGAGGDLIPPAFQRNLEIALKYYAPFTEYAQILDTPDGAPMIWPVSSTVNRECQLVAEGAAVTDSDIGTGKVVLGAFKFGDLVKVGLEISQDSFTSVDGLVVDAFAQSFGRGLSKKMTVGAGTTEPLGIVTAATAGPTVEGDDNANSPDPLTEVGYFDMLALLHSVDIAYRNQPSAKWMITDSTLLALQKLKDKFGHPLWQASFSSDTPERILNKPYVINNYMDEIGANKKPVLFGALDRYKVRRVKNMTVQRLVERYAEFGQVGLIAWARYDGNLIDAGTHPVKYLQCPAS